jgi:predicted amidohydrolase
MSITVAACQVHDIHLDIEAALRVIEQCSADTKADLACFPECFLQGYITDAPLAQKYAINLASSAFAQILSRLSACKPMLVFGLIEEEAGQLFNTAVVVSRGELVGKYRKTHLLPGEGCFTAGTAYPVFECKGTPFGINICYDMQFAAAAAAVARQGATWLVCPANNMMRRENAEKYKELHHGMRIERAKENNIWIVSSDVTGTRGERISYGPTSVISPEGVVVEQVPLMQTGVVNITI